MRSEREQRALYAVSVWLRRAFMLTAMCLVLSFVPGEWWRLLAGLAAALAVGYLPPFERQLTLWVFSIPRVREGWAWLTTAPPQDPPKEVTPGE